MSEVTEQPKATWERSWTEEAARILGQLSEPHLAKKRATIIALVDARLSGASEESVWGRPETCSRTVYHNKWKKDSTFARVLAEVTRLAQGWEDGRTALALAGAARALALASPKAVGRLVDMLTSLEDAVVVRSAIAILDRAGMETATKAQHELGGRANQPVEVRPDLSKLSLEELRALRGLVSKANVDAADAG